MQSKHTQILTLLIAVLALPWAAGPPAHAQLSTTLTYQGVLAEDGVPVTTDRARVAYALWDAPDGGRQVGETYYDNAVVITDGLFTVPIETRAFGVTAFNGYDRWLEISVDLGGGWEVMRPRQPITPAAYALYAYDAPDGGGGGDCLWTLSGSNIYYNSGNVGIGTTSPGNKLQVIDSAGIAISGENTAESTEGALGHEYAGVYGLGQTGVYGETDHTSGKAVRGEAGAMTGATYGVYGFARSNSGRGVYGEAVSSSGTTYGLRGQAYSGDGFAVFGVNEGDFNSATGVYGESWASAGIAVHGNAINDAGDGASTGVLGETSGTTGKGVHGKATTATGFNYGVYGESASVSGHGVHGSTTSSTGTTFGVYGISSSPSGAGVYGKSEVAGGKGIWGSATAGSWAGYFTGKVSFMGDVGVQTSTPGCELDVAGTVKMSGFEMPTGATSGYVLTCNSSGVGTWQEPTGGGSSFTLPYSGSVSSSGAAFAITNTGTGASTQAISAKINNSSSSSDACAGYFSSDGSNGHAIYAESDGGSTVYGYHNGVSNAFYGSSSGAGGARFRCSSVNGYGVKGDASATSGVDTVGGWFESSSSGGKGVYAYSSGVYGAALRAEATGAESTGISATSPWNAIYASGGLNAAKLYGDLRVYEYGTSNQVFHVDGSTGTTSVDVLHITGGSDLAESFDVSDRQAEPGMVVEIDPDNPGKLRIAQGAYNRRVAGVISGANQLDVGMVLADLPGSENSQPIALSGRVWVHCDATQHAISPGDLLTTAERPGHAMAVTDFDQAHGTVIGKAMSALAQGETGMVLVLVNLQ